MPTDSSETTNLYVYKCLSCFCSQLRLPPGNRSAVVSGGMPRLFRAHMGTCSVRLLSRLEKWTVLNCSTLGTCVGILFAKVVLLPLVLIAVHPPKVSSRSMPYVTLFVPLLPWPRTYSHRRSLAGSILNRVLGQQSTLAFGSFSVSTFLFLHRAFLSGCFLCPGTY